MKNDQRDPRRIQSWLTDRVDRRLDEGLCCGMVEDVETWTSGWGIDREMRPDESLPERIVGSVSNKQNLYDYEAALSNIQPKNNLSSKTIHYLLYFSYLLFFEKCV